MTAALSGARGPLLKRFDFFFIPFAMDAAVALSQLMVNFRALDMHASASVIGLLLGLCWGLPYVLTSLSTGWTTARIGPRAAVTLGSALFAAGVALYAVSDTTWMLLLAAPLSGIGCGFFWPSFQTFMRTSSPQETRLRLGIFNVSWTLGILLGGATAGHLYRIAGPHAGFWTVAALLALMTVAIWARARPEAGVAGADDGVAEDRLPVSAATAGRYLIAGWVANFAMWFAGASAGAVFPRLARGLGISDGTIGEISAVVWVGQVVLFAILSAGPWWHYRKAPLVLGLLGGLGAMTLFGWGGGAITFCAAFLAMGASRGPTHVASTHYSLHSGARRGANIGYHEAVLGAGGVFGPIVAGVAADLAGIRAPFAIAGAVAIIALVVVVAMPIPRRTKA